MLSGRFFRAGRRSARSARFASLETELLARRRLAGAAETRMALFEWIEGWYNPRRRHSALGYLSPNDFEKRALKALSTAST